MIFSRFFEGQEFFREEKFLLKDKLKSIVLDALAK